MAKNQGGSQPTFLARTLKKRGHPPKGKDEYNFSVKYNVYIYIYVIYHISSIYIYISHLRAMGETVLELFTGALYS